MSTQRFYSVCPHDCPDTCGVLTEVEDGRAVAFRADPGHPVTGGWLCAKVNPYLGHVYHPDRLQHPLRRAGPKGGGRWERIGWDEAVAEIARRWRSIIDEHGAAAILPYSYSGTLGLVQMAVASSRFWNRLGASRLLRSICGAAAERAVQATLGARRSPPYGHVLDSRLVIIWGHNPVSTAPHFMPLLRAAQRKGTRIVLRIEDNGPGVATDDLARIVEPFEQLGRDPANISSGGGLGLPLVKALAELQGGTLSLESAPGEGFTAILDMPAA